MAELNVPNRTLAVMDNLEFVRSLNSESIDLIAIDPPFAANETFEGKPRKPITPDELAEEKALARKHGVPHREGVGETRVDDVWRWDRFRHEQWLKELEETHPDIATVVRTVDLCATENEAAYIAYMAARLLECHRVLKPTGSIYLHCDHHANSYLRLLMDLIFGSENFRNEIMWRRKVGERHNLARLRMPSSHDSIFWYVKSDAAEYNIQYAPYSDDYIKKNYKFEDERGRYATFPCTNDAGGNRPYEFRGITRAWRFSPERMESMYQEGLLTQATADSPFRYKKYLDKGAGVKMDDVWTDIPQVRGAEKTGYATQKPLALYRRIIRASSNPGDVVLDLFAGCATTAVAAEMENRRWIACDHAYRAWTMIKRRFYEEGYALSGMTDSTPAALGDHQTADDLKARQSYTLGPGELPERAPDEEPEPPSDLRIARRRSPKPKFSVPEMRRILAEAQCLPGGDPATEVVCAGCGRVREEPEFDLDHILPKKDGGTDDLPNRILLCGRCNKRKSARFTLSGLRDENHKAGWTKRRTPRYRAAEAAEQRAAERKDIEMAERVG